MDPLGNGNGHAPEDGRGANAIVESDLVASVRASSYKPNPVGSTDRLKSDSSKRQRAEKKKSGKKRKSDTTSGAGSKVRGTGDGNGVSNGTGIGKGSGGDDGNTNTKKAAVKRVKKKKEKGEKKRKTKVGDKLLTPAEKSAIKETLRGHQLLKEFKYSKEGSIVGNDMDSSDEKDDDRAIYAISGGGETDLNSKRGGSGKAQAPITASNTNVNGTLINFNRAVVAKAAERRLRIEGAKSSTSMDTGGIYGYGCDHEGTGSVQQTMGLEFGADALVEQGASGSTGNSSSNDATWVECDKCKKWRRLRGKVDAKKLPPKWYCSMNTNDPRRSHCSAPEEKYEDPVSTATDTPETASDQRARKHLRLWVRRLKCMEKYEARLLDIQAMNTRTRGKRRGGTGAGSSSTGTCPIAGVGTVASSGSGSGSSTMKKEHETKNNKANANANAIATGTATGTGTGQSYPQQDRSMTPYEWIRCCNPSCGKWRVLLRSSLLNTAANANANTAANVSIATSVIDAAKNGEWYCVLNTWDEKSASCAAPQESLPAVGCPPWVQQDED